MVMILGQLNAQASPQGNRWGYVAAYAAPELGLTKRDALVMAHSVVGARQQRKPALLDAAMRRRPVARRSITR